ncbi:hypothetical protein ACFL2J_07160 [Candidatus Omnitrophota bacterium]
MKKNSFGTILRIVYSNSLKTFKKSSSIFIPFIIFALFEFATLAVIYFIPRNPLRPILGPPISTFWGEKFLHFPTNFTLYPKLLWISKMGLTIFLGSLLTGMAVCLVINIYNKKKISLGAAFRVALKKYISLFIVVLIFTILFYALNKVLFINLVKYFKAGHNSLLFMEPDLWLGPILIVLNFMLAILVQSAFVYTIPILINETANPAKAILRSIILFFKSFFPTIFLVGIPMLIYIPKVILDLNSASLMYRFFPEVVIGFSVLGIVLSTLIMDPIITVCATVLYLKKREEE